MLGTKKLRLEKFCQLFFESKKIWVLKNVGPQNFGSKNISIQKNVGSKKTLVSKYWVKKNVEPNNFWVKNLLGPN